MKKTNRLLSLLLVVLLVGVGCANNELAGAGQSESDLHGQNNLPADVPAAPVEEIGVSILSVINFVCLS